MNNKKRNLKFTLYAAFTLIVLTLITWSFAMIAVPASGPYCPGRCMSYPFSDLIKYYPRDYYWMFFVIFQLFVYLIFIALGYFISPDEKKIFGLISFAFSLVASIVLLIAYFTQISVVPISMMKAETDGISLLTQYNEHGIFIALEELGYISMSISLLFFAFLFSKKDILEKIVRIILISAFLLTLFSFICYTIIYGADRGYRFEVVAITINWLAIITAGILICVLIRKALALKS